MATQANWALDADRYVIIANTLWQSQFPIVRMYIDKPVIIKEY
jgi:hypothetical protein